MSNSFPKTEFFKKIKELGYENDPKSFFDHYIGEKNLNYQQIAEIMGMSGPGIRRQATRLGFTRKHGGWRGQKFVSEMLKCIKIGCNEERKFLGARLDTKLKAGGYRCNEHKWEGRKKYTLGAGFYTCFMCPNGRYITAYIYAKMQKPYRCGTCQSKIRRQKRIDARKINDRGFG